jgi:hypothetical protein
LLDLDESPVSGNDDAAKGEEYFEEDPYLEAVAPTGGLQKFVVSE